MNVIDDIRDLIIARLQSEIPTLQTCKRYAGELEKDPQQLAMRTPAVLIPLPSSNSDAGDFSSWFYQYTFDLLVMCRDLRGDDRAMAETLFSIRKALVDYTLRFDMEPIRPIREEAQFLSKEFIIFTATYAVQLEETYV